MLNAKFQLLPQRVISLPPITLSLRYVNLIVCESTFIVFIYCSRNTPPPETVKNLVCEAALIRIGLVRFPLPIDGSL